MSEDFENTLLVQTFRTCHTDRETRTSSSGRYTPRNRELDFINNTLEFSSIHQLFEDTNSESNYVYENHFKYLGDFYGMCVFLAYHINMEYERYKIAKQLAISILDKSFIKEKNKNTLELVGLNYDFNRFCELIKYMNHICDKAINLMNCYCEDESLKIYLSIFIDSNECSKKENINSYSNIINCLLCFKNNKLKKHWCPKEFCEFLTYVVHLLKDIDNKEINEKYCDKHDFFFYLKDIDISEKKLLTVNIPTFLLSESYQITFDELFLLSDILDEIIILDKEIPDLNNETFETWAKGIIDEHRRDNDIEELDTLLSPYKHITIVEKMRQSLSKQEKRKRSEFENNSD